MFTKSIYAAVMGAILILPAAANAADASREIATAMTHAELAANASDLTEVRVNLQHAVNCLVGPTGAGYDPAVLNPCANDGDGALPDSADAKMQNQLAAAVSTADSGIIANDLGIAKRDAGAAAYVLKQALSK